MKMTIKELESLLKTLLPEDGKPVVVYSGLWFIGRALELPLNQVPEALLKILTELTGPRRTLVMPTYTTGFKNGAINLDTEPSQTGVLTELFRKQPDVLRTPSAFFSFAVWGRDAAELSCLRPKKAWGENSIFEWMEAEDAHLICIGEPWDSCSLKHRAEWKAHVPYRYDKEFKGELTLRGEKTPLSETLFVRSLNPLVENVWHDLTAILKSAGMIQVSLGSGQIAGMSSKNLLRAIEDRLRADPFCFTHDPVQVRAQFPIA